MNLDLPKSIINRLAEIEQERVRCLAYVEDAHAAELCVRTMGHLSDWVTVLHHCVMINSDIIGSVSEFTVPYLRWLRAAGYKIIHQRQEAYQSGGGMVAYDLGKGWVATICLYCSINPDAGATCRSVKVGETLQPIYEIRCDK